MKKALFTVLILFAVGGVLLADGVTPKTDAGDMAFLFTFDGLGVFGIDGFDVGSREIPLLGIGGLYYVTDGFTRSSCMPTRLVRSTRRRFCHG